MKKHNLTIKLCSKGDIIRNWWYAAGMVCFFLLPSCTDHKTDKQAADSTDIFADNIRVTDFQTPEQERAGFKLPPGFEITLFASEPDISKPINMEFDAKGRLWVTNTVEYPMPAAPGKGRDRVTILEDTDGDGKADKFTPFVDSLSIPIGVTPVSNGAIAYSIPNVYRFTDDNNDGKADKAKKLLGPFGFDDTHGMVNNLMRGFDGWIYACHGYANTSKVAGADGDSIKMISGNTFRFREDGSRVEATTFGRINPFGYAYDDWGYLYSLDCHTKPIYQLIPGAQYPAQGLNPPSFGWAPEMMSYEFGSTANSGMVYYTDTQFPEEYRHNFYSGNVVTCRINRNTTTLRGTSPVSKREDDFIKSSDPWFRPVDLKTGPDGSIYIADFYNKIIGHYEVPKDHPGRDHKSGRIWKVTYVGDKKANPVKPTDWSAQPLEKLVSSLDYPQLNMRMMIANEIVDRYGKQAAEPVLAMIQQAGVSSNAYIQGLWILFRTQSLPDSILNKALQHSDPMVQVHALRALKEQNRISSLQSELLAKALQSPNPRVQRGAAEAAGKFPGANYISLLEKDYSTADKDDSHLKYTILLSLRDAMKKGDIIRQLSSGKWTEAQLELVMKVMPEVPSKEAALFALHYLQTHSLSADQMETYMAYVSRYISGKELADAVVLIRNKMKGNPDAQYRLYQTMRNGIAQRGGTVSSDLKQWGLEIAGSFLANVNEPAGWNSRPLEGQTAQITNPWITVNRNAIYNYPAATYIVSDMNGNEGTGALYSALFTLPPSLQITLLDYDLFRTETKKGNSHNAVRIRLAGSNKIAGEYRIATKKEAKDGDELHRAVFDLKEFVGQKGYIEAVDSSSVSALGIGDISPAVIPMPQRAPGVVAAGHLHAAQIAADYKAANLQDALKNLLNNRTADIIARTSAADALMTIDVSQNSALLLAQLQDKSESAAMRQQAAILLAQNASPGVLSDLAGSLTGAPLPLQIAIASALSSSSAGIDNLLTAIKSKRVNMSVFSEPIVKERLATYGKPAQQQELNQLTGGKAGMEDRSQLIAERIRSYDSSSVTVEGGHTVFIQNCSPCHTIGNTGGNIGPKLSGIGTWGQQALTQKILNPNGSISEAFRMYNITLKNGKTMSGLYRREEGEVMVFANPGGQEFSLAKNEIEERTASKYTLMPDQFRNTIAKKDFDALMKYLLSVR